MLIKFQNKIFWSPILDSIETGGRIVSFFFLDYCFFLLYVVDSCTKCSSQKLRQNQKEKKNERNIIFQEKKLKQMS